MKIQTVISQALLDQSFAYGSYRQLIDELLKEGKTTGPKQSENLTHYTELNVRRMKRWEKTTRLNDELKEILKNIDRKMVWVVLTEGWCGDAAHNLPVIQKIADESPLIEVKILLRDANLDVMDAYLTNGGRSIPKLIALDAETLEELGTWGPRPNEVQEMVLAHKRNPQEDYAAFSEKIQKWYAKDKAQSIQKEFGTLIQDWNQKN